ncbi:MAG: isoprenylcysteine carboxylmethyltransferase family protein [Firmicutes bacterium]|nr:isoprenylcysteine carboxylmethyltransferase family protein [Bacillota bacterium]
MNIQGIVSLCLFALLIVLVLIRMTMLRKRGIRIIVFGQTDKSDFLLMPPVFAIVYTAAANTFALPMWSVLICPFWSSMIPGWVGLLLCAAAVCGFAVTLAGFGDSFRVGIDESKPAELITSGMFSISRNPIYVCLLLFLSGFFLIHCNIVIAVAVLLFVLAIHRQILREEEFLLSHYGAEYQEYCGKVRRYL